jgi:hypothetical protein
MSSVFALFAWMARIIHSGSNSGLWGIVRYMDAGLQLAVFHAIRRCLQVAL